MLKVIMDTIKPYPPKVLPKWESFIKQLSERQNFLKLRYLSTELGDYPYVILVEEIMKNCEEELLTVLSIKENFNRCLYLMEPKVRFFIESSFDSVRNRAFYLKTFFLNQSSSKQPIEIVIPVMRKDPMMDLPLMNYEYMEWEKVVPIKIHYHDSLELVSNLVTDPRVKFKQEGANIGIVTIDIIALILKYVNYIDNLGESNIEPGLLRTFLKEEVFFHFHEDIIEIWLINLINEIMTCESEQDVRELSEYYQSNGLIFSDFENYFLDLFRNLQDMKEGKLNPIQLLNSKLLLNRSILDKIQEDMTNLKVRELRQYRHNQFAIDLVNIKLLLNFLLNSSNKGLVNTLKYAVIRKLNILSKNSFTGQFKSNVLRNWIEENLLYLRKLSS